MDRATTIDRVKTLRCRMLLAAAVCIAAVLAVAGVALVTTFERHVLELIGRDLDVRWSQLARELTFDEAGRPRISGVGDVRYDTPRSGAYWEVTDRGSTVLRSASLEGRDLDLDEGGEARAAGRWFEAEGADGAELYVVERELPASAGGKGSGLKLAVALDHEQVAAARRGFQWDAAFVLGLIALVLVLGAALQLGVILQPLSRLREELAGIREGRRDRLRSAVPAEVAPLAEDLNRLLDAQEELLRKARERAGALAHGLKTPIAVLSAECRRLEEEGRGEVAQRLREQVSAIQTHVEREIARARARGASAALGAYVDAAGTARRLVRVMSRMPRGEQIDWRCEAPAELMLRMDPDDFGEVIGNLLDNARKWAAGVVTLRCEASNGSARVVVEDDGPGFGSHAAPTSLTAGDRESSAGLGLVIVQDVLATYGSALWIDRAAQHGVVSFTLPAKVVSGRKSPGAVMQPPRPTSPGGRLAPAPGE
ncbi:HAMP domain-containing histidine kinase [Chelatococcus sambhunathii]|uniref:histidine kinase n=1 Tax=Chelatococcus sambhunathii TaxID=363953 RepID=A0ABU1DGW7_9HYPH|nr:HAMP domain-containing sensor histidine kinase [Chelatococcus sambhunathii]MDR4307358.1 HAMP domain-containing histidine kinase [Chelatococcus sambhunathii]